MGEYHIKLQCNFEKEGGFKQNTTGRETRDKIGNVLDGVSQAGAHIFLQE